MVLVKIGPLEYDIDEYGNIRKRKGQWYIKVFPDKDGYPKVSVTDGSGVTHNEGLHRVQWRAWYGDIPEVMTVDHIDNDKTNSHKDNLQLLTHEENAAKGNAVDWIVTSPDGDEFIINNLARFARENGLHAAHLSNNSYKKWKARKL